jgi:sugar lactone lactonase YvrE
MGITKTNGGDILAAVSNYTLEIWKSKGAALNMMKSDFSTVRAITADYPSMNGICTDNQGNLYFTSGNFNFLNPSGAVYVMKRNADGTFLQPEICIPDAGMANGLYFDRRQELIFFSNTMGGVYSFSPGDSVLQEVYLKLRFMEACDDLCTDIAGNVWMTDPGNSTVKMFNPGTGVLARFTIEGIGQTSSCRIRSENGREMLYISELKKEQKPMSKVHDGRGILLVPAQDLIKLLEPQLIKN